MFRAVNDLTMSDVRVNEIIGHTPCVATRTSTDNNKHCTKVVASPPPLHALHTAFYTSRTPNNGMPQYHTPTGTVSYPDAKSNYPSFPRVGLGRAVVIGIGAGFVGALV
jgi:hypothetical protein